MIIQEGYWKIITLISFEHGRMVGDSVGVSYILVCIAPLTYLKKLLLQLENSRISFEGWYVVGWC